MKQVIETDDTVWTAESFVQYLTRILIPDLREYGSLATAEDFQVAADFIKSGLIKQTWTVLDCGSSGLMCVKDQNAQSVLMDLDRLSNEHGHDIARIRAIGLSWEAAHGWMNA